jgi:hypothetical protein
MKEVLGQVKGKENLIIMRDWNAVSEKKWKKRRKFRAGETERQRRTSGVLQ